MFIVQKKKTMTNLELLYSEIETFLKAELPELVNVERFNNQIERMQNQEQVQNAYPSVYIEIQGSYKQLGFGHQNLDAELILHICDVNFKEFNDTVHEIEKLIYFSLDKKRFTNTNNLFRLRNELDHNQTDLYVLKSVYGLILGMDVKPITQVTITSYELNDTN